MRGKRAVRLTAAAAITATAALAASSGSSAKISALPNYNSQFREGATNLAKAIAVSRKRVRRGTFSMLPPGGRPVALSTTRLAGFPRAGKSFAILSTGDSRVAGRKNRSGSFSRGNGGPFVRGARDVVIYRIDLRVPKNRRCLSFRFRFLTEEFPEFVNDEFNDAFIAELDSTTWTSRSNDDPTIEAPRNFAVDSKGNKISVNATGDTSLKRSRAKGTIYDGATRVLRASKRVPSAGRHRLYLSIFDQGDRQYDSAVFIDKLTLRGSKSCDTGVIIDNKR